VRQYARDRSCIVHLARGRSFRQRVSGVLKKADIGPQASPAFRYREFRPPTDLEGFVECFWRRERWQPPGFDLGVLPDGRVDLIWSSQGELLVVGPQSRPLGRPLPPDVVVVAARFPPTVGPALLRVPARDFADLHVPLDTFDTWAARTLLRELGNIEDPATASGFIARAIARRVDSKWSADPVVRRAAALLATPKPRVRSVAFVLGVSERQLQRRFREAVGYGPKTLYRVLRFRRLLKLLRLDDDQPDGLARIAAAVGYSDQAHLTRECRALSGLTPLQLAGVLDTLESEGATGIFKTGRRAPIQPHASASSHRPLPSIDI
jgi:AraC-like DNA-binding protein